MLQRFAAAFKAEFGVDPVYEVAETRQALENAILYANPGKYVYGVYTDPATHTTTLYTRDKGAGQPLFDGSLAGSSFLRLQNVITGTTNVHFSVAEYGAAEVLRRTKAAQLVTFAVVYMMLGISIVATLGATREKRVYEYLVVCGLDTARFAGGVCAYVLIEMFCASVIMAIFFVALKMVSDGSGVNVVVPFFNLVPAVQYVFAFGYFAVALCRGPGAAISLFVFVGFLPAFALSMTLAATGNTLAHVKVLRGFMQFFLPGMSPNAVFEAVSTAVQAGRGDSVSELLTYGDTKCYSVLAANAIALVSGVLYSGAGYMLDNYWGLQKHPTKRLRRSNQT